VIEAEVVRHHLRLHGAVAPTIVSGDELPPGRGRVLVLSPSEAVLASLGLRSAPGPTPPAVVHGPTIQLPRLRTLHPSVALAGDGAEAVVVDAAGRGIWARLRRPGGDVLVVGTDVAGDLVRYTQGDPAAVGDRGAEATWQYDGERPLYLFEKQLDGEEPHVRHADLWAEALARATEGSREPILPGGAAGAIVVTGDDDQAYLEAYARQLELLGAIPVTYFLHPQTRHTRDSLTALRRQGRVELELHPDALEAPDRYPALLREQVEWFQALTGSRPRAVRNHGYLNDGYWGHLSAWIAEGIEVSTNLPGVDGRVLNGSLLPARVVSDGVLTEHWSVLTLLGDGMLWALDMSPQEAHERILATAQRVYASAIPGVLVLNLHPQSVHRESARPADELHRAVREIVAGGFLAWTVRDCVEWFRRRDDESRQSMR
jgi:hypothetical protein